LDVPIGKYLAASENILSIRVKTPEGSGERWYSGAGIYRDVYLRISGKRRLDPEDVTVQTTFLPNGEAEVRVLALVGRIKASLFDSGALVAEADGNGSALLLVKNPIRWSASNPHLYQLLVCQNDGEPSPDEVSFPIGLREISFDSEKGMLVNGKPEKLKGVCLHQDIGGAGIAATKNLFRQRLEVLKGLGCNAIRTSHNTPSPHLMDLCDEMGFYVIDEFTDKWTTGAYGPYFDKVWERDLSFMIKRDRNRPSVVMWSVGNEVDAQGSDSMLEKLSMLVEFAKKLDSRPVICAMSPHYTSPDGQYIKDVDGIVKAIGKIAQRVDILGLNYQEQWYGEIRKQNPGKLIVGTETYIFFRGSRDNYFNYATSNPWLDVKESPWAIGGFLWAGADYLGESQGFPSKGWCSGIIRSNNERKPISWLFESYWSEKPTIHLTMLDYTSRDEMTREPWMCPPMLDSLNFPMFSKMALPYMIFTNCEKAKLFASGKEYEIKAPSSFDGGIITGYLPMDHEAVEAVGLNGGVEVCRHVLRRSEPASSLVFKDPSQSLSLAEGEQVLLTVNAVDRNGVPVPRESGAVSFAVEGDAEIESAFSADMLSSEPFTTCRTHLFKGAASVIVRTTKSKGRFVAKASCSGLLEAEVEISLG
jgi:beta-galactosidase